jgi:rhodanese-related sulfurtransferase
MKHPITSAASMVAAAKSTVENLTPEQVAAERRHAHTVVVDLREREELIRDGVIEAAVHVPRGLLEFAADPASPYHNPKLVPDARVILHCASGGRSALAAQTLKAMGYARVAHLDGGFTAWKAQGHPIKLP